MRKAKGKLEETAKPYSWNAHRLRTESHCLLTAAGSAGFHLRYFFLPRPIQSTPTPLIFIIVYSKSPLLPAEKSRSVCHGKGLTFVAPLGLNHLLRCNGQSPR